MILGHPREDAAALAALPRAYVKRLIHAEME